MVAFLLVLCEKCMMVIIVSDSDSWWRPFLAFFSAWKLPVHWQSHTSFFHIHASKSILLICFFLARKPWGHWNTATLQLLSLPRLNQKVNKIFLHSVSLLLFCIIRCCYICACVCFSCLFVFLCGAVLEIGDHYTAVAVSPALQCKTMLSIFWFVFVFWISLFCFV